MLLAPIYLRRDPDAGYLIQNPRLISWWHGYLCRILNLEISIRGALPQGPGLLVANHISWLDISVIGSLAHTNFLSKAEIGRWPLVGWLAKVTGTLFIRRGAGQAGQIADIIATRLSKNQLVTIFPEGRTSTGETVRPFFHLLFSAVTSNRLKIIPVALYYHRNGAIDQIAPYVDSQNIFINLYGLMKQPGSSVQITFCPPIQVETADRRVLAEQTRQAILAQLPQDTVKNTAVITPSEK